MNEKMCGLEKNTWELVEQLKEKKSLKCKWVYIIKPTALLNDTRPNWLPRASLRHMELTI